MRRTFPSAGAGTINMPPFEGAVRWLIIANVAVFVLQSLMQAFAPETLEIFRYLALSPRHLVRGLLWELVTYGFLHAGVGHLFFNMLTLWMFGAPMEAHFGRRQFFHFYYFCLIGSGLCFTVLAYTGAFGLAPIHSLVGASGGIFGVLLAFGVTFPEMYVYLLPFPIAIKAKYLVGIWMGINVLLLIRSEDPGGAIAHLGGAFFGYLYLRTAPRRGVSFRLSETWYGLRNRYHKWKRRQAAKKFEVYMREHDRGQYFDDPDSKKQNGDAGKGPWVN